MLEQFIGKHVVVRSLVAGIQVGTVIDLTEKTVVLANCRQLDHYKIAEEDGCSGLATHGVVPAPDQRIGRPIEFRLVAHYHEIIPMTDDAYASVMDAEIFTT